MQRELTLPRLLSFDLESGDAEGDAQAAEEAVHGYDVLVRIILARGLPAADWWNGLADPYIRARLVAADAQPLVYRTRTAFGTLSPEYDEFYELGNVPPGSRLEFEVWDKDVLTPDDQLGGTGWDFSPQRPWGSVHLCLDLEPPGRRRQQRQQGQQGQGQQQQQQGRRAPSQVEVAVQWQPSQGQGPTRLLGPVRFRQQLSPAAGLLMGHFNDDRTMAWSTYKIFLCHIEETFEGVSCPWNRSHAAAQKIYRSSLLLTGVRSQHSALYATQLGKSRFGVLRDCADLFALFNGGQRGGQRRFFTYSLMPDSLRCSETAASFFADMMSKHAMHAGGAEEVLFAGEFCIVPDDDAPGGYRLVIDNNSGTFAPPAAHLPLMRRLFEANFPGIHVETLAADDPRLKLYHQMCPSRVKGQAAAAAAKASNGKDAAGDEAASRAGGESAAAAGG